MATRLYLSTGHAADISLSRPVAGSALWESNVSALPTTRKLSSSPRSTANNANSPYGTATVVGSGTNPNDVLWFQGITGPLAAQTISGDFSGVACFRESATNTNANTQAGVYVVNAAGTVVATLYGGHTNTGALQEFNTPSANSRIIPAGSAAVALSSYACADGDRIVVEIGVRLATTRTGDSVYAYLGDPGGGDLPLNNGGSNNLTINPWVEFSNTLTFGYTAAASVTAGAVIKATRSAAITADAVIDSGSAERTGSITADALVMRTTSGAVTADSIKRATVTGSVSADAWISATRSGSIPADAVVKATISGSVTAASVVEKTVVSSATADAVVRVARAGTVTADAIVAGGGSGSITSDAVALRVSSGSVTSAAVVKRSTSSGISADAWILGLATTVNGSVTADAVQRRTVPHTLTSDASILVPRSATITASAVVQSSVSGAIAADSVIEKTVQGSIAADAIVLIPRTGGVLAAAVILSPTTGTLPASSIIKATIASSIAAAAVITAPVSGSEVDWSLVARELDHAISARELDHAISARQIDWRTIRTEGGSITADAWIV